MTGAEMMYAARKGPQHGQKSQSRLSLSSSTMDAPVPRDANPGIKDGSSPQLWRDEAFAPRTDF
eukprot:scaffold2722_cov233-Pinguiococcus_pyrenoidosus.AAC.8